jgi:hypothetical protein
MTKRERIVNSIMLMIIALLGGFVLASQCGCDGVFGLEHVGDPTATDASSSGGSDGGIMNDGTSNHDGQTNDDGPATDAPTLTTITLTETVDNTIASGMGVSCLAPGGASTVANTWYRAFQVPYDFNVTSVSFGVDRASAATDITVEVGIYTGLYGGATLTVADFTSTPATATTSVVNDNNPQMQPPVPISTTIPAGQPFLVIVAAPNMTGVGFFHLGFTTSMETEPGYFSSPGSSAPCSAVNPPESTDNLDVSVHVVIDVTGTH